MKTQSILLVSAGILIGCGAGATVAASWAGPTAGQWQCYNLRHDDIAKQASDPWAVNPTHLLNTVAKDAPRGAMFLVADGVPCIKN